MSYQPKKDDIVCIQAKRRTSFVNGSRPAIEAEEWDVVRVASATRKGIVTAIVRAQSDRAEKLAHMSGNPRVFVIACPTKRQAARDLFDTLEVGHPLWDTADELRDAIRTRVL
jgi:hypothetical protein